MLGHLGDGTCDHDRAAPGLDRLLQLRYPHLGLDQLSLGLLPLGDGSLKAGLDAASHAAAVLHPASLHQLLYKRLHVDVEPLVEDDLTDALLYQLVVCRPDQVVIPDADELLEDREEVGLALGVHHQVHLLTKMIQDLTSDQG